MENFISKAFTNLVGTEKKEKEKVTDAKKLFDNFKNYQKLQRKKSLIVKRRDELEEKINEISNNIDNANTDITTYLTENLNIKAADVLSFISRVFGKIQEQTYTEEDFTLDFFKYVSKLPQHGSKDFLEFYAELDENGNMVVFPEDMSEFAKSHDVNNYIIVKVDMSGFNKNG